MNAELQSGNAGEGVIAEKYLYWTGCAANFDGRIAKVVKATVSILRAAGIKVAFLGEEEVCTGDPARRLGEEGLFQQLALQNIETLQRHDAKQIVTHCAHCFHVLKNEYPRFGGEFEEPKIAERSNGRLVSGRQTPRDPVGDHLRLERGWKQRGLLRRDADEVGVPRRAQDERRRGRVDQSASRSAWLFRGRQFEEVAVGEQRVERVADEAWEHVVGREALEGPDDGPGKFAGWAWAQDTRRAAKRGCEQFDGQVPLPRRAERVGCRCAEFVGGQSREGHVQVG